MTREKSRFVWTIPWVLGVMLAFCTAGLAETVTVKGTGKAFKYKGAAGSLSFTVTEGQPAGQFVAEASTTEDWITIDPAYRSQTLLLSAKGVKKGTVKYTVAAYTRSSPTPRTGVIQVAGQQFMVTQSGTPCKVTLSAPSSGYPAEGDNGLFAVTAPPGCAWNATVDVKAAPWIAIEGGPILEGEGEASVAFAVSENTATKPRTGKIYVTPTGEGVKPSKKTHTVKQLKGGGPKLMRGVAAAGAPIVGRVTIKDSSTPTKEKFATIAADGKYTIDVTDMTGPFALRADGAVGGREYHLYSAATQADAGGIINITPFTDLIVANIAGDIAASYFDSGAYSTLTKDEIDAEEAALQAKLEPILTAVGLEASIDLLRTAFSTDHAGLDGVLDVVKVTVDPTTKTAELLNVITDNAVTLDVATGGYAGAFTQADGTATADGLTDLQKIVAGFDKFSALFATGLPSPTNATLLGLFDAAAFIDDGIGLNEFLSQVTSDRITVGLQFTNIAVVSLDPVAGTGEVRFDVVLQGRVQTDGPMRFKMIRKNGTWLMQGNQRIAYTGIDVKALYRPAEAANAFETGLVLTIRDDGQYRNESNQGINYAVVKGPGLSASGVVLVNDIESNHFSIVDPATYPQGYNSGQNFVDMDDAAVGFIPATGADYTVTLWYANGTPMSPEDDVELARYRVQLRARPYRPSELSTANFPAVTSPTLAAWRAFNGGTVNVAWSIPAGCYSDYVSAYLWGPEGSAEEEKQPGPAATSTSLNLPARTGDGHAITVQSRNLDVSVMDDGGRSFTTILY